MGKITINLDYALRTTPWKNSSTYAYLVAN